MRFYYQVPDTSVFGVIHADSIKEAQHKLMHNSAHAHLYRSVEWLSGNDTNTMEAPPTASQAVHRTASQKVAILPTPIALEFNNQPGKPFPCA